MTTPCLVTDQPNPTILRAIASVRAGEAIRAARIARGLSQQEFADRACLSPQALSAIEHGHTQLWPRWRQRIARALDCEERELFEMYA